MKLVVTFLLTAASLLAQGTISGVSLEKTDRMFTLKFDVTPAISNDAVRCWYDYDTVSLDRRTFQHNALANNSGRHQCFAYDLVPATKTYVSPSVSDSTKTSWSTLFTCTGICTNCGSGDNSFFADGSGLNCDGVGEYPNFTTDAEDTDPTPAAVVTSAVTSPPTVTGGTYTVASGCADLATKKASAITDASDGDVVELVLPAGEECPVTNWSLDSIPNGGIVIVRSSANTKLLPPANALADKATKPYRAKLTMNMVDFGDSLLAANSDGSGWYFENVDLGMPDLDSSSIDPVTMNITAINTTTDTITVDDISSLPTGNEGLIVYVNLSGTGVRGGYGPMQACNVTSTTPPAGTLQLRTGVQDRGFCTSQGTLVNLVGTYTSGGTIRRWAVLPIAGHTSSGGNHALTVTGHGLSNFPNMTITTGSGAFITVSGTPSEYQIGNSSTSAATARACHVEGSGAPLCDGFWQCTDFGSSVIQLSRSGVTPDCNAATGTVHAHRAFMVFNTNNDTIGDDEPRPLNLDVVDANTLEVAETTAIAGVTGGYLTWEPDLTGNGTNPLLKITDGAGAISSSVENVTIDRAVIEDCFPYRGSLPISFGSTENVALVNSWVNTCYWRYYNPINTLEERIVGYSQAGIAVGLKSDKGLFLDNNYFGPSPFIFDDDDNAGSTADDVSVDDFTLSRNYGWVPDWTVPTHSSWRSLYFQRSFLVEHKSAGPRMSHYGNYFKGWYSNFAQINAALTFSTNGSNTAFPNGWRDVGVEYNIFDRGGAILQNSFDYTSSTGSNKRYNIQTKFRIANNLIVGTDVPTYGNNSSSGMLTDLAGYTQDMSIVNNTFAPQRCIFCNLINANCFKVTGFNVTDNIFVVSEGSNSSRMGVRSGCTNQEVPSAYALNDGGYSHLQNLAWRGTATDIGQTSSYDGNVHIPGIHTSSSGSYASKAASLLNSETICKDEFDGYSNKVTGLGTNGTNSIVGASGACSGDNVDSLNQRLDLVFDPGTWSPISPTYDGKGVGISALGDAQGFVTTIAVSATSTTVTVSYHAPSATGCYVDLAPWDTDWATTWATAGNITRTLDTSSSQTQSVQFTGLSAATKYAYRIWGGSCRKLSIGQVTTAGT